MKSEFILLGMPKPHQLSNERYKLKDFRLEVINQRLYNVVSYSNLVLNISLNLS